MSLQPHQQRVVEEHKENAERVVKLRAFINGPVFPTVVEEERRLLTRQCAVMRELEAIHVERLKL
jgi:hypothetical protein